jgi:tetratricopeptide (TPR) repeat protein
MLSAVRKLFRRDAAAPVVAPQAASWRTQGNEALAAGDLERAQSCYLQGTQPPPGNPMAWLNLGYVQLERGEHEQARISLRTAESLLPADDPALPDVWALVGRERQERGEWGAAAAAYRRVVERIPLHDGAWRELGQVYELQGQLADAETAYTRALAVRGDFELALRDLARVLLRQDKAAEALPLIERCLKLAQPEPETHVLHARALWLLSRWPETVAAADRALATGYDADAMTVRGLALTALRRPEEALACHDEVLAHDPDAIVALIDSARALLHLRRFDEALARADRAVALDPGRRDAAMVKALVLNAQLRCGEALEIFERELARGDNDPEVVFNASFVHLLLGDLERGWQGQEARWNVRLGGTFNRQPDFGAPPWRGESLSGRTLLLYAEQGLGDSLQFLRYVPPLAVQAARIYLVVQEPLLGLLGERPANVELLRQDAPRPRVDFACALMSLPAVLNTTLDSIPQAVPYLAAPAMDLAKWRERLGPRRGLRVGLVWSGNPKHANDYNRSIPLAVVRAAADSAGKEVEFVSLQKEVRASDADVLRDWPALRHLGDELETFGDTAAVATLLDRVISVDTSVAHLVGALGRPLSVLLPSCPDWRWLLDRDDSPWYPTATLYRQPAPGEWGPPMVRAIAEAGTAHPHRED